MGFVTRRERTVSALVGLATVACSLTACAHQEPVANGPTGDCGTVTYPATGQPGTVVITGGGLSCATASSVVNRYLTDPALTHEGNTWSTEFDGWLCASPTATAAEEDGYSSSCARGSDAIAVRQSPSLSSALTFVLSPASACDAAAIGRDLGQQLSVERCYGNWAYVNAGELGDSQSLLRLVDGSWTRYTGFPSSSCKDKAAADGVPGAELSSFPPC